MSVSDPDPIGLLDAAAARPTGFVTAEWRHIVILSYAAHPALLTPLLPSGVELDLWNGEPFLSVVGLLIERISVLGVRLPFYRQFEQINLRFYARRRVGDDWRRGVVFVKECVPYRSLAFAAHLLYRQNYEFARMKHRVETEGTQSRGQQFATERDDFRVQSSSRPSGGDRATIVEYCWRRSGPWNRLGLKATGPFAVPPAGSLQEFVTERHWGYAAAGPGRAFEFEVRRPAWVVSDGDGWLDCDPATVYGKHFSDTIRSEPASALLAAGSPVGLGPRARIPIV